MSAQSHRLYFRIQLAAARLKVRADGRLLAASGVTTSQAAVLTLIGEGKARGQKQLAAQLRQNESAIAQMLSKLEKNGLVERAYAEDDRRRREFRLTGAGCGALERLREPFASLNEALDEIVPLEEQAKFATWLERISEI